MVALTVVDEIFRLATLAAAMTATISQRITRIGDGTRVLYRGDTESLLSNYENYLKLDFPLQNVTAKCFAQQFSPYIL